MVTRTPQCSLLPPVQTVQAQAAVRVVQQRAEPAAQRLVTCHKRKFGPLQLDRATVTFEEITLRRRLVQN